MGLWVYEHDQQTIDSLLNGKTMIPAILYTLANFKQCTLWNASECGVIAGGPGVNSEWVKST